MVLQCGFDGDRLLSFSEIIQATFENGRSSLLFVPGYLDAGLCGVALSRLTAMPSAFVFGALMLRRCLKVDFDKAAWKAGAASMSMVLSLLALEPLRALIKPSSYQFLVLSLRSLPVYGVVGVMVCLVA